MVSLKAFSVFLSLLGCISFGGYYYLLTTTWTDVSISRATTLNGLKTSTKKVVYSTTTASRCCNVWSPEAHYFDGVWYIYYTGVSTDLNGQRVHVLVGGATPWDTYTYRGQLTSQWGIDGTVLRFNAWGNYLSLCIAPLTSPTAIGTTSIISTPAAAWEIHGGSVNEAPAALYHGGKTYLTFSESSCWTNYYALGLLTWDGSTDPTKSAAWSKKGPVLSSANGNYGPGSNGFFTSPDGTQIWNTFNADANSAGACDSTRYTMAEVMNWNSDGSPNFTPPATLGTTLAGPSGE
ncbi:arabinofuranosidase [Tricladium varicosporioides]|nr:arabinofuranosidase [Hymenoscyphus varicosporioides]